LQDIGVLTFHRCINYGSYWQARCLVEGLRSKGVSAVLLEHRSGRVDRAEWRCALQPTPPALTTAADRHLYASKIRKFFVASGSLPLSSPFPMENPAEMQNYELVIVGSDEVWNFEHPWYGHVPLFFGEGLRAKRVASYAASFGSFTSPDRLGKGWCDKLRRLDSIAVRDLNSQRLIQTTLGVDPELVLDPCLQFPQSIRALGRETMDEPYLAIYGHSFPNWFKRGVQRSAREKRLRLVSIGYHNDWADEQRIDTGPEAFARLVAGATAVATNFFHGCIFSLINEKPFVCALSNYRMNKVQDLTQMLGARGRVVTEATPQSYYLEIITGPLEAEIAGSIATLRNNSNRYFGHVLQ
jgi:hypothetical protein